MAAIAVQCQASFWLEVVIEGKITPYDGAVLTFVREAPSTQLWTGRRPVHNMIRVIQTDRKYARAVVKIVLALVNKDD